MEEEIRVHLEMRIRENLQAGMSPEAARADALRRFGNVNRIKDGAGSGSDSAAALRDHRPPGARVHTGDSHGHGFAVRLGARGAVRRRASAPMLFG
jgi:hypothetical protein